MSRGTMGGAGALLAAPLMVIVGVLLQPTISDEPADRAAAILDHRQAVIAGTTIQTLALLLLIAGTVWLAISLARSAPRLAFVGGVLGVFGSLVVLFEAGIAAAGVPLVQGLGAHQASALLDRINSSTAASGLEPLSILGDLGLAILGVAAVKAGAPRSAGVAIAAGAFCEGAGFGTGTQGVVVAGFAVLFVGLAQAVRALAARRTGRVAAEVAPGY